MDRDDIAPSDALAETCRDIASLVSRLPGTLRRLSVQAGEVRVELEWAADARQSPEEPAWDVPSPALEQVSSHRICADMVGVFYAAPEPGAAPFVSVGDEVKAGQQVAIIEAMKLMTPVTADCVGVVTEVLAESGKPVEFGTPLLAIEVT
jgi:acetyl-CoA carboxylase biotin carboxyl carrier protein